jgi:hypothetical protein
VTTAPGRSDRRSTEGDVVEPSSASHVAQWTPAGASIRAWWWVTFALLAAIGGAWALASPLGAAPDEPSHVITAVAMAHGQFRGSPITTAQGQDLIAGRGGREGGAASAYRSVTVPQIYGTWNWGCDTFQADKPATCRTFAGSDAAAHAVTPVMWYPPAYYLVVGTVARVAPAGPMAVYVMRFVSVALFAALVASGATSLLRTRRRGLALVGLLVALTPMCFFLGSSVNPSGLEIAAGVSLWCSGAVLAFEAGEHVDPRLVARVGCAATVLILARHPGPFWAALIVALVVALMSPEGRRRVTRARAVRRWAGVAGVATAGQLAWLAWAQPFNGSHTIFRQALTTADALRGTIGAGGDWLHQMVGNFGWLDSPAPFGSVALWLVALGGLVLLAVLFGGRRELRVLGLTIAASVLVPIAAATEEARTIGLHWQARYQLPVVVGVPVLAALTAARGVRDRDAGRVATVARVTAFLVVVGSLLAFDQNLRRYTVGLDGSIAYWLHPAWSPPLGPVLVLVVFVAATIGLAAWFLQSGAAPNPAQPRDR